MIDDIKITMLGTTGAGKTCYLLGMYSVMQTGVNGFTLSAKDMDVDLDLNDLWEKLVDTQGEDRWPPPNAAEVKDYDFDFSYGFQHIMSYKWVDYRGRAMSDRSTEGDVQRLMEHFENSSCLFLCISGEYLKDQITPDTIRKLQSHRMTGFLQKISNQIKPTPNRPFPVAIVITKYDLCSERKTQEIIEEIKQNLYPALFTPNSGWLVMICPVSLGKDLSSDLDSGNISPENVHLPVVFAIYSKLREHGLMLKGEQISSQGSLKSLENTNFFMKWLHSSEIKDQKDKLYKLGTEIQKIEKDMILLAQELQKVPVFLNGKEVTIDV
ncbi:MAG: hypothetical protein AAGF26_01755 [Cyanobacteria bacterium P01_G01_bin.49]